MDYFREWSWQGMGPGSFTLLNITVLAVFLGLHFLPSVIAFLRTHHDRWAIFALNFFLGWTGIGWIVALIWSLTAVRSASSSAR